MPTTYTWRGFTFEIPSWPLVKDNGLVETHLSVFETELIKAKIVWRLMAPEHDFEPKNFLPITISLALTEADDDEEVNDDGSVFMATTSGDDIFCGLDPVAILEACYQGYLAKIQAIVDAMNDWEGSHPGKTWHEHLLEE